VIGKDSVCNPAKYMLYYYPMQMIFYQLVCGSTKSTCIRLAVSKNPSLHPGSKRFPVQNQAVVLCQELVRR
jgi:hypothetical protein